MNTTILNATIRDLPEICRLFEEAIAFQRSHQYTGWNDYDKNFLEQDIEKKLLYKIIRDNGIVCIFSVCYSDPLIWREKERGDALYLHRIVLNRRFAGIKIFPLILDWAMQEALACQRQWIRMDTWADNHKLINYYHDYGFRYIEEWTTGNTTALPVQHRNLRVVLLEIPVGSPL